MTGGIAGTDRGVEGVDSRLGLSNIIKHAQGQTLTACTGMHGDLPNEENVG
eukprot:JZ548815.1.p3 GENE.JZ548815.1~~JZ548815.1.p3  ORF type:complete len:51 (-),score=13.15 JZ548815.1:298-450(-)